MLSFGKLLRSTRQARDLSISAVASRMSPPVSMQAISSYEHGERTCSLLRFYELCEALDASPTEFLSAMPYRKDVPNAVELDLRAVVHDRQPRLTPLRRWAAVHLSESRSRKVTIWLSPPAIQLIAELCGMDVRTFVAHVQQLIR
ncbi:helix-turn-helix domain-containing protein [Amycolatopsis sp. cmx-11-12]|uniref:helix-turn-helix domain-containing protein n=1 Tax=Amycolatopsis sp. cmx-11-12 TaxID=2785795 RepID=UPI0039183FCE